MVRKLLVAAMVCGFSLQGAAYADGTPTIRASDADISHRVTQTLLQADRDVAQRIHVSTVNGVVTLEGTLFSSSQVLKVLRDASR